MAKFAMMGKGGKGGKGGGVSLTPEMREELMKEGTGLVKDLGTLSKAWMHSKIAELQKPKNRPKTAP